MKNEWELAAVDHRLGCGFPAYGCTCDARSRMADFACPNDPPCRHGRMLHDGDGNDEPFVCCADACGCGKTGLGWWAISGDNLLAMLRRAHAGDDPDLIYAEEYANSDHEAVSGVAREAPANPVPAGWAVVRRDVFDRAYPEVTP